MQRKVRSRKDAVPGAEPPASPPTPPAAPAEAPRSDTLAASAAAAAAPAALLPGAPGTSTTVPKRRVRRKPPVTTPKPAREAIRTVDERLKDLADVPSLRQPPP
ncbi:MAG: hypothetical protein NTW87_16525, partial [Planctomycetota bacterium]|nr:hypothetical protein [Planctomycetota bacterium]